MARPSIGGGVGSEQEGGFEEYRILGVTVNTGCQRWRIDLGLRLRLDRSRGVGVVSWRQDERWRLVRDGGPKIEAPSYKTLLGGSKLSGFRWGWERSSMATQKNLSGFDFCDSFSRLL